MDEEKGGKEPTNLDAVSLAEALDELHGQPLARLRHLSSATTAAACWRGKAEAEPSSPLLPPAAGLTGWAGPDPFVDQ